MPTLPAHQGSLTRRCSLTQIPQVNQASVARHLRPLHLLLRRRHGFLAAYEWEKHEVTHSTGEKAAGMAHEGPTLLPEAPDASLADQRSPETPNVELGDQRSAQIVLLEAACVEMGEQQPAPAYKPCSSANTALSTC